MNFSLKNAVTLFLTISVHHFVAAQTNDYQGITATGSYYMSVSPDKLKLTIAADASNESIAMAKEENQKNITEIIQILTNSGITKDQIVVDPMEHSNYSSVSGSYDPEKHFSRNRTISVTMDIAKYESLAYHLTEKKILISTIDPLDSQLEAHQKEALKQALKNAKAKAEILAQEAGANLGELYYLSESESVMPVQQNYYAAAGYAQPTISSSYYLNSSSSTSLSITINQTVTASFRLKK